MSMRETIGIEGTLLMMDDITPHAAVPVQVVQGGKVVASTLCDERGRYQFVNLPPGIYQVRCQVSGSYIYYGADRADQPEGLKLERGKSLKDIDFRIAPFKKGTWSNHTYMHGLAYNNTMCTTMCACCVAPDDLIRIPG